MHYGYFPTGVQSAKKSFFFLNSVLQQDVCGETERKMYFSSFLAFLLSHTLRFHPHSRPFHSPLAHAFLTWEKIRAVLQSIWGVVLPD